MKTLFLSVIFSVYLIASVCAEVKNVNNQELKFLISEGIPIIDIREEFEWKETGIIPESHLLTFYDSDGKYDIKIRHKPCYKVF